MGNFFESLFLCVLQIVVFQNNLLFGEDILETFHFTKTEGNNYGSLFLKEAMPISDPEIKTGEYTFCIRYKSSVFDSWAQLLFKIMYSNDLQTLRKKGTYDAWLWELIMQPPTNDPDILFIVSPNPSKLTKILAEGGTYYTSPDIDKINAGEWYHFCGGSSVKDRRIFFVQNGKTTYNWSQPESWVTEENFLSSLVLGKPNATYLDGEEEKWENMVTFWQVELGNTWHRSYYLTDFNIWGRALSKEEMVEFTTCKVSLSLFQLGNFTLTFRAFVKSHIFIDF